MKDASTYYSAGNVGNGDFSKSAATMPYSLSLMPPPQDWSGEGTFIGVASQVETCVQKEAMCWKNGVPEPCAPPQYYQSCSFPAPGYSGQNITIAAGNGTADMDTGEQVQPGSVHFRNGTSKVDDNLFGENRFIFSGPQNASYDPGPFNSGELIPYRDFLTVAEDRTEFYPPPDRNITAPAGMITVYPRPASMPGTPVLSLVVPQQSGRDPNNYSLPAQYGLQVSKVGPKQTNGFATASVVAAIDHGGSIKTEGLISTPYGGLGRFQNLLLRSDQLDQSPWYSVASSSYVDDLSPYTVTADAEVAPDGSQTAENLSCPLDRSCILRQDTGITTTAEKTYTFSVWVKASYTPGQAYVALWFGDLPARAWCRARSAWCTSRRTGRGPPVRPRSPPARCAWPCTSTHTTLTMARTRR